MSKAILEEIIKSINQYTEKIVLVLVKQKGGLYRIEAIDRETGESEPLMFDLTPNTAYRVLSAIEWFQFREREGISRRII